MVGRSTALGVVIAAALACAQNPATGERQINLVSKGQEVQLGRESAAEVARSIGVYGDQRLQKYVAGVGERMAALSERPALPWQFQVVDDAAVNAFALPGGFIFVTRGILAHLDNEAQLASVLGHEIAHVTAKHAVERMSKAQLAQLGLGIGMLVSENVRRFGDIGVVGLNLLFLKFSRDDETQADELGLRYAHNAGYDVREMPKVFEVLGRVSERAQTGRLPEWLATHPNPERRVEKTQERLARLDPGQSRGMLDTEEYLRLIDGMEFGPNPRQGFFQGDRFLHPDLKFAFSLPSGWRKANLRDAVVAVSPDKDGAIQLGLTRAASPQAGLQEFFSQPGVQLVSQMRAVTLGLPSTSARFAAESEQGPLAGLVTFLSYGGRVYQLVSFAAAERWPAYSRTFVGTHGSFAPLTDPKVLAVQAARLQVERAPRDATLTELYNERPASVPLEVFALINQMNAGTQVKAGQLLKWVRGGLQAGLVSWR